MSEPWGVHWFRRDLRVMGNPALQWSWKEHQGRVVGLFCLDSKFLSRSDFSVNRFGFFLETLRALQEELRLLGGDLWVVDCMPQEAFARIAELFRKNLFKTVSFNRDYEPFAKARDTSVIQFLEKQGVKVHTERDHLLIEPHELIRADGSFYRVYGPYARRWREVFQTAEIQKRLEVQRRSLSPFLLLDSSSGAPIRTSSGKIFSLTWHQMDSEYEKLFPDRLQNFLETNQKQRTLILPEAGSQAALKALQKFALRWEAYSSTRDFPGIDGTSRLSHFLKNGSLTSAQIIAFLASKKVDLNQNPSAAVYLSELIWREFYYSILFYQPSVEQQAFLERYRYLPWENSMEFFDAWKEGKTGYPIVDAGMRQLKQEGWMHNRVRMIVASFLTKDLLIDWRWGENYFMKELLDGDLAPNNGGWQWAASTGCDPQPYFRIFNPWLQSQKFDPEGKYIQKYVVELSGVRSPKEFHSPERPTSWDRLGYVHPIVDHRAQKPKALKLFQRPAE